MGDQYFSQREQGIKPRIETDINSRVWGYLIEFIKQLIENGSFGLSFSEYCPDPDGGIISTDRKRFTNILSGEVPELSWPLDETNPPQTIIVMDLLEFCHKYVSKPTNDYFHNNYGVYHLKFDVQTGQKEFRDRINNLFSRNGLAYEFQVDGKIRRIIPHELESFLINTVIRSGDSELDRLLATAIEKYHSLDLKIRKESLEKLWDAWERIKSIEDPNDKKSSVDQLLNRISIEPVYRQAIENEAKELTRLGNDFMIRHSEVKKVPIQDSLQVDYFFMRMFTFIFMILSVWNK